MSPEPTPKHPPFWRAFFIIALVVVSAGAGFAAAGFHANAAQAAANAAQSAAGFLPTINATIPTNAPPAPTLALPEASNLSSPASGVYLARATGPGTIALAWLGYDPRADTFGLDATKSLSLSMQRHGATLAYAEGTYTLNTTMTNVSRVSDTNVSVQTLAIIWPASSHVILYDGNAQPWTWDNTTLTWQPAPRYTNGYATPNGGS